MNIQLNFSYINEDNIRVISGVVFSNPDELSIDYVEAFVCRHLIAERYFIAREWFPLSIPLADHDGVVEFESIDATKSMQASCCITDLFKFLTWQDIVLSAKSEDEYVTRKAAA